MFYRFSAAAGICEMASRNNQLLFDQSCAHIFPFLKPRTLTFVPATHIFNA
jgi:hypothetical protein